MQLQSISSVILIKIYRNLEWHAFQTKQTERKIARVCMYISIGISAITKTQQRIFSKTHFPKHIWREIYTRHMRHNFIQSRFLFRICISQIMYPTNMF
mmetsp:Transcript_3691/g.5606  ORF Transcript_3691/g.5606 Transcript_3691/m.5606 type:complete len:98 (+) Transcript_3691:1021-1314(+)